MRRHEKDMKRHRDEGHEKTCGDIKRHKKRWKDKRRHEETWGDMKRQK